MADRYGAIREALPILMAEAQAKGGRNERAALIVELLEERDALAAALEAAREDAERYRWLRQRWGRVTETYDGDSGRIVEIGTEPAGEGWDIDPETLDAAIDAAMLAAAPEVKP